MAMRQKRDTGEGDLSRAETGGASAAAALSVGTARADERDARLATIPDEANIAAATLREAWDERKIAELVALMGVEWVERRLDQFAAEIERRMASLASATPSELARSAHALMGMAGYFGFHELLDLCARVQRQAREGSGLDGIEELRAAGEKVFSAIRINALRASRAAENSV
jgi:HPt (histidine-containing phosphotransfer) domain-containing protein